MTGFLESILSKVLLGALERLYDWLTVWISKRFEGEQFVKDTKEKVEAVNAVVVEGEKELQEKGEVSAETEAKLRETTRALVRGSFTK